MGFGLLPVCLGLSQKWPMIFSLPVLHAAFMALMHCISFGPALPYLLIPGLRFVTHSISLPLLPLHVVCCIVKLTGCAACSSQLLFVHHHPLPHPLVFLPGAWFPLPPGTLASSSRTVQAELRVIPA